MAGRPTAAPIHRCCTPDETLQARSDRSLGSFTRTSLNSQAPLERPNVKRHTRLPGQIVECLGRAFRARLGGMYALSYLDGNKSTGFRTAVQRFTGSIVTCSAESCPRTAALRVHIVRQFKSGYVQN